MVVGNDGAKDHFCVCVPIRYSVQLTLAVTFAVSALTFIASHVAAVRVLGGGFDMAARVSANMFSVAGLFFAAFGSFAVYENNVNWLTIFYYFFIAFIPLTTVLFGQDMRALTNCEFVATSIRQEQTVPSDFLPLKETLYYVDSCFEIRDSYMLFFFLKAGLMLYCGVMLRRAVALYAEAPVYHVKFHDLLTEERWLKQIAEENAPLYSPDEEEGGDGAFATTPPPQHAGVHVPVDQQGARYLSDVDPVDQTFSSNQDVEQVVVDEPSTDRPAVSSSYNRDI